MSSVKQRRVVYSQNLLHSRKLVAALVGRSSIGRDDLVIEIGLGKGIITEALAERSGHVLAIEKDPNHAEIVRRRLQNQPNVTLFACHFLEFPLPGPRLKSLQMSPTGSQQRSFQNSPLALLHLWTPI